MTPTPPIVPEQKRFPIMRQSRYEKPHPIAIPWSVAEAAYSVYRNRYGDEQSLMRLGERGGFGPGEMDDMLPDWRERCAVVDREVAALQIRLAEAEKERAIFNAEIDKAQDGWRHCEELLANQTKETNTRRAERDTLAAKLIESEDSERRALRNNEGLRKERDAAVKDLAEQRQATFDQVEDKQRIGNALMAKLDAAVKAREEMRRLLWLIQPYAKPGGHDIECDTEVGASCSCGWSGLMDRIDAILSGEGEGK